MKMATKNPCFKILTVCQHLRLAARSSHTITSRMDNLKEAYRTQSPKGRFGSLCCKNAYNRSYATIEVTPNEELLTEDGAVVFETKSFSEFDKEMFQKFSIENLGVPVNSDSFADFMNFSKTLQALVLLGVELFTIEKRHPDAIKYLIRLDLKKDIKPRLQLLHNNGVLQDEFGSMITKNPRILDPDVSSEEICENFRYLADKGFAKEEVTSIILRCPTVLTIPVAKLDGIFGFYQKLPTNREQKISFSNSELRTLIIRCPRLITSNLYAVYEQIRTLELSCEFTLSQIRSLVIGRPDILVKEPTQLEHLYKFYVREMKFTNEELVRSPKVLMARVKRVMERHYYLKHLKKDQYKCDQPGYVPLLSIVVGNDEEFCENLKLGDVKNFKLFIKTL